MRRTRTVPRGLRVRSLRSVAVVLTSLALLLCGAVEVLPSGATGPLAASPAAAATVPGSGATRGGALEAPGSSLGVRAAGLVVVPAPNGPGSGLPPTGGPLVAPHLVADPRTGPPTSPPAVAPSDSASGRAPPGPAGT